MKANVIRIKIAMAENCMTTIDVYKKAKLPKTTFNNVLSGRSVRPATLGRVARALEVDVREIMANEEI